MPRARSRLRMVRSEKVSPAPSPQRTPRKTGSERSKPGTIKEDAERPRERVRRGSPGPTRSRERRLEKGRENRKARVGQEADGDGRDLDGLEEHRPVGGQDEAADGEEDEIAGRGEPRNGRRPRAMTARQGQAGEDNAAEDEQNGGEGQPFPEQPREAEEKNGQVDLERGSRPERSASRRHGRLIIQFGLSPRLLFGFPLIFAGCAKINFTFLRKRQRFLPRVRGRPKTHVLRDIRPEIQAQDVRGGRRAEVRRPGPSRTPSPPAGSPRPTCSRASGGRARRPSPASWPRP